MLKRKSIIDLLSRMATRMALAQIAFRAILMIRVLDVDKSLKMDKPWLLLTSNITFGASNVLHVMFYYMESIWATKANHTAKKITMTNMGSNVHIARDSYRGKSYKLEITTIFIQHALAAQNVEIHLGMVRKCIFKVLPSGIQDVALALGRVDSS
jgi:hypothetical protein